MSDGAPDDPARRLRPAARIFVLDPAGRVLLFRFTAPGRDPFWIMPGGECDPGEDFPAAAVRELLEETGIAAVPAAIGVVRQADYVYLGEPVRSIEHYFVHRVLNAAIDTSGHTEIERAMMRDHRWFAHAELTGWDETIYPLDIADLAGALLAEPLDPSAVGLG